MLDIAVIGLASSLFGLVAAQSLYVFLYSKVLGRAYRENLAPPSDGSAIQPVQQPLDPAIVSKTAIVLCLRGVDPILDDCLNGILSQQPEGWQFHIVCDDEQDPAAEFVRDYFSKLDLPVHRQPQLHFNLAPPATCSLKCSSLTTVLKKLPPEIEFVAFIDADTIADPRWLADLMTPFADPKIGATTGNRWFTPDPPGGAAEVRKIWNAAAIVQMLLYNIAWGGSLALRRSVIEQCNLLDRWEHSFCEDTQVADALAAEDLKLRRVPHLIVNSTEDTDLQSCFSWIVRQMLTVRLHHKLWPLVLLHGLFTGLIVYATPLLALACLLTGFWWQALALGVAYLVYQTLNIALLINICGCNQRMVSARKTASLNPTERANQQEAPASTVVQMLLATVLNQLLYPVAILQTWFTTSTRWRGIDYAVSRDGKIRMQQYIPYREIAQNHDPAASIQ